MIAFGFGLFIGGIIGATLSGLIIAMRIRQDDLDL